MIVDAIISLFIGLLTTVVSWFPSNTIDLSFLTFPTSTISGYISQLNYFFPMSIITTYIAAICSIILAKFVIRIVSSMLSRELA